MLLLNKYSIFSSVVQISASCKGERKLNHPLKKDLRSVDYVPCTMMQVYCKNLTCLELH